MDFFRKTTCVLLLALLLLSLNARTTGAYGVWEPEPEKDTLTSYDLEGLDGAINRLEAAIELAEENRSAHPDFLVDLWDILAELRGQRDYLQSAAEPLAAEDPEGIPIDQLEPLAGTVEQIADSSWETDNTRSFGAFFPEKVTIPAVLEADVTYLSGNRELQLGILTPDKDMLLVGGTGAHGSAYFAGHGTLNSPGNSLERTFWSLARHPGTRPQVSAAD